MGQANTKNSTIRPLTSQCKLAAVPTATRVRRIRRMARKLQRQLTNGELLGPREHGTWDDLAEDQHKRDRHNHRHKLRHNHVEKYGECLVLPVMQPCQTDGSAGSSAVRTAALFARSKVTNTRWWRDTSGSTCFTLRTENRKCGQNYCNDGAARTCTGLRAFVSRARYRCRPGS